MSCLKETKKTIEKGIRDNFIDNKIYFKSSIHNEIKINFEDNHYLSRIKSEQINSEIGSNIASSYFDGENYNIQINIDEKDVESIISKQGLEIQGRDDINTSTLVIQDENGKLIELNEIDKSRISFDTKVKDEPTTFKLTDLKRYSDFKRSHIRSLEKEIEILRKKRKFLSTSEKSKINKQIFSLQEALNDELTYLQNMDKAINASQITKAIALGIENDKKRLDKLSIDVIKNAEEIDNIITYYKSIGSFEIGVENYLFDNIDETIKQAENDKVLRSIINSLKSIKEEFIEIENKILQKRKELVQEKINSNPQVQRLGIQDETDLENIIDRMDDISIWDLFMHNTAITSFSEDNILPQIMMEELRNMLNIHRGKAYNDFLKKLDRLQPIVEKKLKSIKKGFFIGTSYDIFYQRTELGFRTNKLISRFSNKWYKEYYRILNSVDLSKDSKEIKKQFLKRDKWLQENAEILDIKKLSALKELFKDTDLENEFEVDEVYETKIKNLLGKDYNSFIKEQKEKIDEYLSWKENLDSEKDNDIIDKARNPFEVSDNWNKGYTHLNLKIKDKKSPFFYNLSYVTIIPKKEKTITIETGEQKTISTNFYDENFSIIENDNDIYEFWKVLMDISEFYGSSFSDDSNNIPYGSIPQFEKNIAEKTLQINEKGGFFTGLKNLIKSVIDGLKKAFSTNNENKIYAKDKEVINKNYQERFDKEVKRQIRFLTLKWKSISEGIDITNVNLSELNETQIQFVSELINANYDKNSIYKILGSNFNLQEVIKQYSQNRISLQYSQDIPKIFRTITMLASEYNARKEIEPFITILKDYYSKIERNTENSNSNSALSNFIRNRKRKEDISKLRERAIKRLEFFYNKSVKGNYDSDPFGIFKGIGNIDNNKKRNRLKGLFRFLSTGKVFTSEEKEMLKTINPLIEDKQKELSIVIASAEIEGIEKILKDIKSEKIIDLSNKNIDENTLKIIEPILKDYNYLITTRSELGSNIAISSIIDSILHAIIFKGLAYNVSSGITNRIEGIFSNAIADSAGLFWTPGNLTEANLFITKSFKKRFNKNSKEALEWEKMNMIMQKYRILQEASNEMQKNAVKSSIKNLHKASPYHLSITAVEIRNQGSPLIAIMMDTEIVDKDGNKHKMFENGEFTAFDIKNGELVLKEQFRTDKNIKIWEQQNHQEFHNFKSKVMSSISAIHGDFEDIGGFYLKGITLGRMLGMFKTWLPMQIWLRFGKQKYVLGLGIKNFKGRYYSHTPISGGIAGSLIGFTALGPVGFVAGSIIGTGISFLNQVKTEVNPIKELLVLSREILKRTFLLPFNTFGILKKYGTNNLDALSGLSDVDRNNLSANITDIAVLLNVMIIKALLSSIGWDDDDDEKQTARYKVYLFLENKTMNLISNSTLYANPRAIYDSYTQSGVYSWLISVEKLVEELTKFIEGGKTDGSKIMRKFNRAFLPTFVNYGGIGSYMKRDWTPNDVFEKVFQPLSEKDRIKLEKEQHIKDLLDKGAKTVTLTDNGKEHKYLIDGDKIYSLQKSNYGNELKKDGSTYRKVLNNGEE